MGRGKRHTSKTGDGGGERRHKARVQSQKKKQEADLVFHDDPSSASEEDHSDTWEESEEELVPLEETPFYQNQSSDEDEEEAAINREKIENMGAQWGKSKQTFYADENEEYEDESDADAADVDEEEAALEIQRQQNEELGDEDFGEDISEEPMVEDEATVKKRLDDIAVDEDEEEIEVLEKDMSKISKKEKLEMVNRSSPEVLGLAKELKAALKVIEKELQPAVAKLSDAIHPSGQEYLQSKLQLYLNYCANISFYLNLKANGNAVQTHPVLKHLLKVKAQIESLEPINSHLQQQIERLVNEEQEVEDEHVEHLVKRAKASGAKEDARATKRRKKAEAAAQAEKEEAMAFYKSIVDEKASTKRDRDECFTPVQNTLFDDDVDASGKRGATYQIMKNRGLVAHKNKINRNPRVKKRVQYRKAIIRRKGQVRDMRTGEAGHYAGELTGIKANVSRSRKIRN